MFIASKTTTQDHGAVDHIPSHLSAPGRLFVFHAFMQTMIETQES